MPGFVTGITYLSNKYRMLRRVRGDGNCFYRSCFFGYLENMLSKYKGTNDKNKEDAINEKKRIINIITFSKQELIDYGYSEIAIESFYDIVIELFENLFTYTQNDLLNSFQASGLSDYYTWYMRLLTSLGMKKNADRYLPFIDDADMNAYCLRSSPYILLLLYYYNPSITIALSSLSLLSLLSLLSITLSHYHYHCHYDHYHHHYHHYHLHYHHTQRSRTDGKRSRSYDDSSYDRIFRNKTQN